MIDQYFELLERKNLCFRSFHSICTQFLSRLEKDDVSEIIDFQRKRQNLIQVLEDLESKAKLILDEIDSTPGRLDAEMTAPNRSRLDQLLSEKDSIVHSILDLDLQILKHIDKLKDDTIQKLHSLQSGKRNVSRYKSPLEAIEAAEGITRSLDEKA